MLSPLDSYTIKKSNLSNENETSIFLYMLRDLTEKHNNIKINASQSWLKSLTFVSHTYL